MSSQFMTDRSMHIFRQIVQTYLESGDASGSRNLSKKIDLSLSPASIRNVMSDLEDLGLIFAPHTSAGRLPTQAGLRFFVDSLIENSGIANADRQLLEKEIQNSADESHEKILRNASQILSGVSQGAGIVMTTKINAPLKQIEFVRIEPQKALVILVFEDGSIENRLMSVDHDLPESALVKAANYINAQLIGKSLAQAQNLMQAELNKLEQELDLLSQSIIQAGIATWAGGENNQKPQSLIVRGQANLLDDVKAQDDLERLRQLFQDFETQSEIIDLLSKAEGSDGVKIFIGKENNLFSLSGSSVVVAPYHDEQNSIVGVVGVVGPTRLNYPRIIPVVDYAAQMISDMLGKE